MKTLKKTIALFLAIVFFLSSLGFTVNKVVCLESGKVEISLTQVKDCCPDKTSPNPVIKTKCCCVINSTSFHLNDFNSSQKNDIPLSDNSVLPIDKYLFTHRNRANPISKLFVADLPPPCYGRQLLSFISVFII